MDALLRRLARDHWVRLHGTPRVTVLVGGAEARALWERWAQLAGLDATLVDDAIDDAIRRAVELVVAEPSRDVAIIASRAVLERWRTSASDRLRAMVDEGLLVIDGATDDAGSSRTPAQPAAPTETRRRSTFDARSAAEAALFDALEATPATAGRFELNGRLSVRFGPDACEVDLLDREDAIAIEIDGVHHFDDPDRYRRDRRKDVLLQANGLFVIRLLAEDVMRDPRIGVALACQALAYRRTPR